jgi:FkbM family methyltransferase
LYQLRELFQKLNGHSVWVRERSTDPDVACDVFIWEEYGYVDFDDVHFVIDCGSYAGYSTLYFLEKYPKSLVLAIEADDRNLAVCRLNVAHYGEKRVRAMHAAVWGSQKNLVISRGTFADGREWATTVGPGDSAGDAVQGVAIGDLLDSSGRDQIDILKMNVEGSERDVFSADTSSWLPRTRNLIVSLHDKDCDDAYFRALAPFGFYLSRFRNATYCTNIQRAEPVVQASPRELRDDLNLIQNADFQDFRVAPAVIEEGNWIAGSSEPAKHWNLIVCDPQLEVALAIRLGEQRTGETALRITNKRNRSIQSSASPYVALQNDSVIEVQAGERYRLSVDVRVQTEGTAPQHLSWGFYCFLRIAGRKGAYEDLSMPALHESTNEYAALNADLVIPDSPLVGNGAEATAWLYAWLQNDGDSAVSTGNEWNWQVYVDRLALMRV